MFNRNRRLRVVAAVASTSLLAGCGLVSSDSEEEEQEIVVGTMSAPTTLDPAAAWDGSWELYRNIFQTLVAFPPGATEPEPDAAESCRFVDTRNKAYECTLREGLTFSDGAKLDADAVKHSVDRIVAINDKRGPAGLLGSLDRVEAKDERTVTFYLNKPDATFPFVLSAPAFSIVSPKGYPADKLREGDEVIGSGPYTLEDYKPEGHADLAKNAAYKGPAKVGNNAVSIQYFKDSGTMVEALKKEEIDVTFRGLAAEDVVALNGENRKAGIQLVEAAGTEIRYLVFNPKDPWAKNPAVRKAVAQTVDRGAIAHKVYRDTVEPLYSMVPRGLTGHATSYFDRFGKPDENKAAQILSEAGINEPVPLTLWYTTDRYGSATEKEFQELKRQLDGSGLFDVTIKGRPWKTFEPGYRKGEYPVFGRGWFPDFPDADNFIAPFVGENNALSTPYVAKEITDDLLPQSRRESDRGAVAAQFEKAQSIMLEDTRLLPLWQGKQYIAASEEIAGAERALDPSAIMMMWELSRKQSW
ncbi:MULTISPECIES: ABC transporter substrate-binding protein [Streptomyces]|uniref:Peptide-binding protein n=1 Tax=Streptomyces koyangensis TaxID=188770 RepID=A0A385DIZ0_9ACTN|nr:MULTISPECIES: ABC transporter substrate-binding protein [Streptomyces]AXQ58338.1 peptide-binding protein [Streptomyces koyangensis]KIX78440.1 peptide-binding protein [Streptomyces sp. MBRL 601]PKR43444.1 peptide-binding protein [Streptomyces sp. EAG2]WTD01561.1 ABC transporter substrate-binding protein [Streptomyces albidoflavus]